jgi:VanZ family protein
MWGPVVLYILLILAVSSVPRLRPAGSLGGLDKLAHLVEYAILGVLLRRAVTLRGVRGWLAVVTVGAAIGFLDEWYQSSVPGRVASIRDWLADTIGVCLGMMVYSMVARRRGVETEKGE